MFVSWVAAVSCTRLARKLVHNTRCVGHRAAPAVPCAHIGLALMFEGLCLPTRVSRC